MRVTGIVERVDDYGRLLIPKEIRRKLRIREADRFEIFLEDDDTIIFKKYCADECKHKRSDGVCTKNVMDNPGHLCIKPCSYFENW